MTPAGAEARLRELLGAGDLDLPAPGAGDTRARFRALHRLAAVEDVSVARLAEAHCDAAAIVAEAGGRLPDGILAGVWASKYRGAGVTATRDGAGWRLDGEGRFCSGATLLDAALVDARREDGRMQLFLVPLRDGHVEVDASGWSTAALAATATAHVGIDVHLDAGAAVGEPDFYLSRPGFWHGAIGVAACWAGGAEGVHAATIRHVDIDNPHALANVGRTASACRAMTSILDAAAADIDARRASVGMTDALIVRHLVSTGCRHVIEASQRATGPGPLAYDASHGQRIADLRLYIEQHHHESDLAEIGRHAVSGERPERPDRSPRPS